MLQTPDFISFEKTIKATSVKLIPLGIEVTFETGDRAQFHKWMLREQSPDETTTHPVTREQQKQLLEFPDTIDIGSAELTVDGNIRLRFEPENLETVYSSTWLHYWWQFGQRNYQRTSEKKLWDESLMNELDMLKFDYQEVIHSKAIRKKWFQTLDAYGFVLTSNAPSENETVEKLANLIGPIRPSNFGYIFDVQSKANADSNAYTAMGLPVHTDLCTREYLPGLQLLHCMENASEGGETILVDGFRLGKTIAKENPEEFHVLTTQPFPAANKAKDTDYRTAYPVFRLLPDDSIDEVRVNPWLRAPMTHDINEVDAAYKALKCLFQTCELPELRIQFKLQAGDAIVFDNRRILHGRTEIHLKEGAKRHLRGCYLEREELASQLLIVERSGY